MRRAGLPAEVVESSARAGHGERWRLARVLWRPVLNGEMNAGQGLPDDLYRLASRLNLPPIRGPRGAGACAATFAAFDLSLPSGRSSSSMNGDASVSLLGRDAIVEVYERTNGVHVDFRDGARMCVRAPRRWTSSNTGDRGHVPDTAPT